MQPNKSSGRLVVVVLLGVLVGPLAARRRHVSVTTKTALCRETGCGASVAFSPEDAAPFSRPGATIAEAHLALAIAGHVGDDASVVGVAVGGAYVGDCGGFGLRRACVDVAPCLGPTTNVTDAVRATGNLTVGFQASKAVEASCAYAGFPDVAAAVEATLTLVFEHVDEDHKDGAAPEPPLPPSQLGVPSQ